MLKVLKGLAVALMLPLLAQLRHLKKVCIMKLLPSVARKSLR